MTIKIKRSTKDIPLPCIIDKGEWIDLYAAEDKSFMMHQYGHISLGVAMQLPKGCEAIMAPRSSTYKNFGIILANSIGIIDSCFCGNDDVWSFPAIAINSGKVMKGDRICQFRIQLSQKATLWQKIRWLFTSKIKIKEVESLSSNNRGGIGSTGKNNIL